MLFCPSDHLILLEPRCPVCGWARPQVSGLGKPAWGPLALPGYLGGPGLGIFARAATAAGVIVFPLSSGELVGVAVSDGSLLWRKTLPPGKRVSELIEGDCALLASLRDENPLELGGKASLISVEPASGQSETMWDAPGHELSAPRLEGDHLIVRTTTPELLVFDRLRLPSIRWRQKLQTWWPVPPALANGMALVTDGNPIHDAGTLTAFSLQDGRLVWQAVTAGLLSLPVQAAAQWLVYVEGARSRCRLVCRRLNSGELSWQCEMPRLYGFPQVGNERVYTVERGNQDGAAADHYILQARSRQDGSPVWRAPISARINRLLLVDENTLLLTGDRGLVMAFDLEKRSPAWEFQLGSDEDPVRVEMLLAGVRLITGTACGKIVALQLAAPALEAQHPEERLKCGDFAGAATAYILKGQYIPAAELFRNKLDDPLKSLTLYEAAKAYSAAGELALELRLFPRALQNFTGSDDLPGQGRVYEASGDYLNAARSWEKAGRPEQAAINYEKAGLLREALKNYRQASSWQEAKRLAGLVPPTLSDIEELEKQGEFEEAAQQAMKIQEYRRAEDDFQKANNPAGESDALQKLLAQNSEPWAWQRLADIARRLGDFQTEYRAWRELNNPQQAVEACQRAARQLEQVSPEKSEQIASLYNQAALLFSELGHEDSESLCWSRVWYHRQLPKVILAGRTEKAFTEGSWNTLELGVKNVGWGMASMIKFRFDPDFFEMNEKTSQWVLPRLRPEKDPRQIKVYLKPLQHGEAVPLHITWSWSKDKEQFEDWLAVDVRVRDRDDSRPTGGGGVNIYGGTYIHTDKNVMGDEMSGEAHKGDRVEIQHGESARRWNEGSPSPTPEQTGKSCPLCHLPVKDDAVFCGECGNKLSSSD